MDKPEVSVDQVEYLKEVAHQIRRDIVRQIAQVGDGHPGGALGAAELFAALYFAIMDHDASEPTRANRDRFVLSNGHICAALYSALARSGYLPLETLSTLRALGSDLQGHPARQHLAFAVETSAGPLGQGLSVANGLAIGNLVDGFDNQVYCLLGDGELQEGQVWEAFMTAAHYRLANITVFISYNGIQIDGRVDDVMGVEPLYDKLSAFNWNVSDIDGHDITAILSAVRKAKEVTDRPTAVICRTVLGKGVPFMENEVAWHGGKLSMEQAQEALTALGPPQRFQDFPIEGEPNALR